MGLREEFLEHAKRPAERKPVQFCGRDLFVRKLTGEERDAWETEQVRRRKNKQTPSVRATLVVACLCDVNGALIFTPDDADQLGKMDASILDPVFDVAQRFNALTAEDVKDAEKN